MNRFVIAIVAMFGLSSCSTNIEEYEGGTPAFDLEQYFNGQLIAYGMVQDYSNKLTRHFCVDINASWKEIDGKLTGIIDEDFLYDDGEIDKRIWTIVRHSNASNISYTGTASDINGEASGYAVGNAFRWRYDLDIPIKDEDGTATTYTFAVDDWLYRLDEKRAFNRSDLNKLGITLGQVTLFFEKLDDNNPQKCTPHTS